MRAPTTPVICITSTWIVPAGITLNSSSNDVTSAIAWLSAGVAGARYTIVNRIATAGGRTAERVLYVDVRSNEVS